jgi:hypothetical protein
VSDSYVLDTHPDDGRPIRARLPDRNGYGLEWREGARWEPGVLTIDDSHDERPAYRLTAGCSNCGWTGEVRKRCGVDPRHSYPCPQCGCPRVTTKPVLAGTDP